MRWRTAKTFETMLDRLGFPENPGGGQGGGRRTASVLPSISLDTVEGLGTYAEIEVITENEDDNPTAAIETIAKEIGVKGEPILASYLELLLAKSGK